MNTSAGDSDSEWEASTLEEHESFLGGSGRTINTLLGLTFPITLLAVFGGSGGRGGHSNLVGGTGGTGEGPRFRLRDPKLMFLEDVAIHSSREPIPLVPDFENFRKIRLGDLIVEENLGVVQEMSRHGRGTITSRRVHAAKLFGFTTPFTVTIYEGKDAKEEWEEYIAIHSRLRHPNVLQLFGLSTAHDLYAAVFHQEHISFEQARESYTLTAIHKFYFHKFFKQQFWARGEGADSNADHIELHERQCTPWLHRTGIVCFEVAHSEVWDVPHHSIWGTREVSPVPEAWLQHSYDAALQSAERLLPPQELSKMFPFIDFKEYYDFLHSLRESTLSRFRDRPLESTGSARLFSWVLFDGENIGREVAFLVDPEDTVGLSVWCNPPSGDFELYEYHHSVLQNHSEWSRLRESTLSRFRDRPLESTGSARLFSWVLFDGENIGREVAFLVDPEDTVGLSVWCNPPSGDFELYEYHHSVLQNHSEWSRKALSSFPSNLVDHHIGLYSVNDQTWGAPAILLSQAGYVLSQLGLDFDVCSVVRRISVYATIHPSNPSIDEAELFLPPLSAFLTPNGTHVQYPTQQPYWFDPMRQEPLSGEEAEDLGLPAIELRIVVQTVYLDKSTLEHLREFHRGKGFDPDSQDIAKHLGHPLYYFGKEGDPLPEPMRFGSDSKMELNSGDDFRGTSPAHPRIVDRRSQKSPTTILTRTTARTGFPQMSTR
ncbi:hypothetical protein R3P38DRAFT_2803562 [Favolaschia claudopus]|uniref:Protein kinase domain-containing protein n=1 Tax=Favolaschia claudopus TaxID=2862362 RepID=A0AAV9ZSI3_9AGAR